MLDSSSTPRIIRFGIFELDLSAGELRKNGGKVKIQEQPLQVLEMLLEKPGGVVTREDLRQKLWSDDTSVDFDHGLNKAMNKLREALGDSAGNPRFIETLPRRGYRFITSVEGLPVSVGQKPAVHGSPWQAGKAVLALTGVALVALLLVWGFSRLRNSESSGPAPGQVRSLAVLPLENLSGNGEQDWLADGMTDLLINELGKITALERVISRQSVMRFKGTDKSLPEIARELQVDAILEGTVIRVDNQVRISVQLVHASPERSLWSESYERDFSNILAIQRDVARDVARQINIKLTPDEQVRLTGGSPAVIPAAYEDCLKGRYHWNKRSKEGFQKSIEYFERALEKDPNHAPAYAGLADTYILLGSYNLLSMHDSYPKAKAAALKALELDDTLAEAHTSLAAVLTDYDWDWAGAERHFRRAIELNPNYPVAHYWYAEYLSRVGRHDQALEESQKAIHCDPLSSIANTQLGWIYYLSRQYEKSTEQFQYTLELDPNFAPAQMHQGYSLIQTGRYEEAVAAFQKAGELGEGNRGYFASIGCSYAAGGMHEQAREVLRIIAKPSTSSQDSPYLVAAVYANLGEPDRAFEWLEIAQRDRDAFLGLIRVEPLFDPLRDDPRYRNLIRRMKFPQ